MLQLSCLEPHVVPLVTHLPALLTATPCLAIVSSLLHFGGRKLEESLNALKLDQAKPVNTALRMLVKLSCVVTETQA